MADDDEAVLAEQRRYYRERAPEYDDWWFRRGRYAHDPPHVREAWFADGAEVERALEAFDPAGDVLELAGGTGLWTRHLARRARALTVVDASPEVLAINRDRVGDLRVDYVVADVFAWERPRAYDVCFFGFWLSHVPESRFVRFWESVAAALRPGGRVFLVDSSRGDAVHTGEARAGERELRRVTGGRVYEIVKRFYDPGELTVRLEELGWRLDLRRSAHGHFLYGSGERYSSPR